MLELPESLPEVVLVLARPGTFDVDASAGIAGRLARRLCASGDVRQRVLSVRLPCLRSGDAMSEQVVSLGERDEGGGEPGDQPAELVEARSRFEVEAAFGGAEPVGQRLRDLLRVRPWHL